MISISTLRQYRIFDMAIFDLTVTLLGAFITHYILWTYPLDKDNIKERNSLQYIISLIIICITFIGIGIISHRIFNIKSTLSGYLGLGAKPKY